jgi:NADPH-dependent curcumin reductase CurA
MISQYNLPPAEAYPIKNLMQVVAKRLKIQGFIVGDENMGPKYFKEHQEKLQKWISEGSFKAVQSVTEGIDRGVDGFLGMLKGDNFGEFSFLFSNFLSDSVSIELELIHDALGKALLQIASLEDDE